MELREENDLNAVLESLNEGIMIADSCGTILMVNRKWESLCGIARENAVGKNVRQLVEDGIVSESTAAEAMETAAAYDAPVVFNTNAEALERSIPIVGTDGRVSMIVTTLNSLRDLRSMENECRKRSQRSSERDRELKRFESNLQVNKDHLAVDKKTVAIFRVAKRVAAVDEPVLLHGPLGIGKENVARYIHANSPRAGGSFVHIYSYTLQESSAEGTLFGFEDQSGAFHPGLLEQADGGTAYIDELLGLPERVQSKLLGLLHDGVLIPESGKKKEVSIRFVFGSVKTEQELAQDATMNREWYFVLSVFSIRLPPLREKKDDIIPLLNYFLELFNQKYHTSKRFGRNVYARLLMYDWPGNIREMKIMVNRAVIISEGEYIELQDLFLDSNMEFITNSYEEIPERINLKEETEKLEADYMERAYAKYKSTRAAAKSLGMDSSTFVRKRQAYLKKGFMKRES